MRLVNLLLRVHFPGWHLPGLGPGPWQCQLKQLQGMAGSSSWDEQSS